MCEPDKRLSWAVGRKTVLCIGPAVMECISIVKRFPRPDYPERSVKGCCRRGGKAANICTVLRNLGVDVEFFGVLSTAPIFNFLVKDMRERGIKIDNCPRSDEDMPYSSVIVNRKTGDMTTISCDKSMAYPTILDFEKLDLSKYGWIHFHGQMPKITIKMLELVQNYNAAQTDKIKISMDVVVNLAAHLPLVDYCDYVFFYGELAKEHNWTSAKLACMDIDELLRTRQGINLKRPLVLYLWSIRKIGIMDYDSSYIKSSGYKGNQIVDQMAIAEVFIGGFIYAIYARDRGYKTAADFGNSLVRYKCRRFGFDHIAEVLREPVL